MRQAAGTSLGGTARDRVLLLVGVGGVAFCLTLLFLAMRAVLDIGGACADGGPYVPRVSCPSGVPLAMVGGIFGLFLFGGLTGWYGTRIGPRYGGLVFLAWPALFLSLGWNFLEYGFRPPGGDGWAWGWLISGVLFVLMGGGPLLAALPGRPGRAAAASVYPIPNRLRDRVAAEPAGGPVPRRPVSGGPVPGRKTDAPGSPVVRRPSDPAGWRPLLRQREEARRRALLDQLAGALRSEAADRRREAEPHAGDADLVTRLERLAALHDRGAIDATEYALAKHALILDAQRSAQGEGEPR